MFFGEGRIPIVQKMILADNEKDRRAALDELLPLQRADFYGVFKEMHGIAGHDPDDRSAAARVPAEARRPDGRDRALEATGKTAARSSTRRSALLHRVEQLHEFNPMLGHRGVRLGITYPEITEMQARAIIEAACQLAKEGGKAVPEIMIPLVGDVRELRDQKAVVVRVADEVMKEQRRQGEVPGRDDDRGAARRADGRRDREGGRLLLVRHERPDAADLRVLARRHRQVPGRVPGRQHPRARSVRVARHDGRRPARRRWARRKGRATKPNLKVGVCGEHGGDPSSILFFDKVGLDYVSCSPYRVPVARLAAAQAALKQKALD